MKTTTSALLFLLLLPSTTIGFTKTILLSGRRTNGNASSPESPKSSSKLYNSRRQFISTLSTASVTAATTAITLTANPSPSNAGEVGARITKAVTQSDLGISVRRSVVRGAQLMDEFDGKWEKFSDDNGLGSQRLKQQPRPKPREVPDLKPLNKNVADCVLLASREAFLETVSGSASVMTMETLQSQVEKVDNLVRKSFERSGLDFTNADGTSESTTLTAPKYNYYCYTTFKAMCDILIEKKLPFDRKKFESALGEKLLPIFAPSSQELLSNIPKEYSNDSQMKAIDVGLQLTDEIIQNLVAFGFCALAERNDIENEEGRIADWAENLTDLQMSIPLDGDITLNSQILLQEQGFRLYPDFGRFVITSALQKSLVGMKQSVSSDEYYMDTSYSSDPDLFEVKQVLLNIVIDSV